jgi:hypothetical protein
MLSRAYTDAACIITYKQLSIAQGLHKVDRKIDIKKLVLYKSSSIYAAKLGRKYPEQASTRCTQQR